MSRERPIERCPECGNVLKMEYLGPTDDGHGHGHDERTYTSWSIRWNANYIIDHHAAPEEPKTFADFVRPEYR